MNHSSITTPRCLTFNLFRDFPELKHGSFARHAEEHIPPYQSLEPSARQDLGAHRLYWAHQCHGTDIIHVTTQSQTGLLGDALITKQNGIALLIQHADCQPALFYDPVERVVAAVHSGWRGTVQNIYGKVVDCLSHVYHCQPQNLRVAIGPSLGPTHAEFIHYRTELPPAFWDYQPTPNHFDFWAISEWQLRLSGVLPEHIEVARLCTYANSKDWFSYRRDKTTGRNGTLIALEASDD